MHPDGRSPHILVVNDSPEVLDLKREIFEDEGFRLTTRITHDTDLEEVVSLAPDLVIIDYSSEGESALLHQVTTNSRTAQIPVVLCTGAVRQVEAIKPELDARGVAVVYKPFDIDYLVRVVRDQLGLGVASDESVPPRAE